MLGRLRTAWVPLLGALALAPLAACSGDDDASDTTSLPIPTNPPTTTINPAMTTAEAPTTVATSTTTTTSSQPPPTLPPTTTTTAPDAPSVTTLVPTVPKRLLSQKQANRRDINNNRPIEPKHVPIIEAYLTALQVSTAAFSEWPLDPKDPELIASPRTARNLKSNQTFIRDRARRGHVLNVEQGVTFRPYVAGPVGNTATLYDCELAGHFWQDHETGGAIPPDQVWVGAPGRIVQVGLRWEMVRRDGDWLVEHGEIDPEACS